MHLTLWIWNWKHTVSVPKLKNWDLLDEFVWDWYKIRSFDRQPTPYLFSEMLCLPRSVASSKWRMNQASILSACKKLGVSIPSRWTVIWLLIFDSYRYAFCVLHSRETSMDAVCRVSRKWTHNSIPARGFLIMNQQIFYFNLPKSSPAVGQAIQHGNRFIHSGTRRRSWRNDLEYLRRYFQ